MGTTRNWLLASAALVTMFAAAPALAQQSGANQTKPKATSDASDNAPVVEELVVTTERRATHVQDTPLAVQAYTEQIRENLGIETIQSLAQFSPGVSYSAAADRPTIRGVGRANNSHGLNSPVAQYLDGFYVSTVQDTARRPIFVDRVEVVSGPQGALAGKGSAGGAFYTYMKRPQKTFEADIGGFIENYQRSGIEGTITGPINDSLRYRINGARYVQTQGFFKNLEDGFTEGSRFGTRSFIDLMLAGNVGSRIDFFLKASGQSYNENLHDSGTFAPFTTGVTNPCIQNAYVSPQLTPSNAFGTFAPGTSTTCGAFANSTGTVSANPGATIYGAGLTQNPVFLGSDVRNYANNYHNTLQADGYYLLTFDATYHAPLVDVRYIVGRSRYHYTQTTDNDGSPVQTEVIPATVGNVNTAPRLVDANGVNTYQEEPSWYSNELTFASTWKGPLQGILGFYQYNQYTKQPTATTTYAGFPELARPVGGPVNAMGPVAQYGNQNTRQNTYAVFTQWDYKFNDKWTLTGGLRYNSDKEFAREEARDITNNPALGGGANALVPFAIDISSAFFPGFATLSPNGSGVLPSSPPRYSVLDPAATPGATVNAGVNCGTVASPLVQYAYAGLNVCANQRIQFGPGVIGVAVDPVTGMRTRTEQGKWHALTGGISLSYKPTDDGMIYVRYARGYRPGGFGAVTAGFLPLNPYADKESLNTYELGAKFTFFDRLQIDADLFRYDYKNIQVQLSRFERCLNPSDISSCTAVSSVVNLPSGINQGLELTSRWYATQNLLITANYGYLDAHIKNGLTADGFGFQDTLDPAALLPAAIGRRLNKIPCGSTPANVATCPAGFVVDPITRQPTWTQDISGDELPNAPHHKIAANASYTFHLPLGSLTASYSYIWRSKAFTGPDVFEEEIGGVKPYSQSDARLIFRQKDGDYQIIIFGNNIFNQTTYESGTGLARRGSGLTPAQVAGTAPCNVVNGGCAQNQIYYQGFFLLPPRSFGVEFVKRFR